MGDRQDKGEVLWRAGAISSPKITAFIEDQSIFRIQRKSLLKNFNFEEAIVSFLPNRPNL
jgi:hypothetical protein